MFALAPSFLTRILTSYTVSNFIDRALLIVFMWWVTELNRPSLVTIFLIISLLPHLINCPFSGKIIKRFNPVKVVLFSDTVKSLVFLCYGVFLLTSNSAPHFIELVVLSFIASLGTSLFNPAMMSLPVYLSDCALRQQKVSSYLSLSFSLSIIGGPLLGASMLKLNNGAAIFLLAGFFYFIAVINNYHLRNQCVLPIKAAEENHTPKKWSDYKNIIFLLVCFCCINLVFMPIQNFIPLYTKFILQGDAHVFALLETALGVGSILGALLLIKWGIKIKSGIWLMPPFLLAALGYMLFAMVNNLPGAMIALTLLGAALSVGNILSINYYHSRLTPDFVPQVMAMVNTISSAAGPLAMGVCGLFIQYFGLTKTMMFYSLCMILISVNIAFIKALETNRRKAYEMA